MSCNSMLYATTNSTTSISSGTTIALTNIIRRRGQNVNLSNTNIALNGQGYYDVKVSATLTAVAAGDLTVTVYQDGVAIPGANATVTSAGSGDYVNLDIVALARVKGCPCSGNDTSTLSLVFTGTTSATPTNVAVVVLKAF